MKRTRAQQDYKRRPAKRAKSQTVDAKVARAIRRMGDLKYCDFSVVDLAVGNTGEIASLTTNIVRGDTGINGFDGNEINPQGLSISFYSYTNQVFNSMRLMVFQWFDSTLPTLATILQSNVSGLATISATTVGAKSSMRVLFDDQFIISPSAGAGTTAVVGEGVYRNKVYIPGSRMRKMRFITNSSVVTNGNIYALFVSDDGLATFPAITAYFRLSFFD